MAEEPEARPRSFASRSRAAAARASSTRSGSTRRPRRATTSSRVRRPGRRRPVQRAVPAAGPRSTSSTASRAGSRSTTRTRRRPAVAATRSRWKRAPKARCLCRPRGCGSGCARLARPSLASISHRGEHRRRRRHHDSRGGPGRARRPRTTQAIATPSVRIVESLEQLGGQVAATYPEKHVYDVAGHPKILGQKLVDLCVEQGLQYGAEVILGEEAKTLERSTRTARSSTR